MKENMKRKIKKENPSNFTLKKRNPQKEKKN